MARKKTHEEFVQEVYDLVGDDYEVIGGYKLATIHIKMKHKYNNCGYEYEVEPNSFLRGYGKCPMCSKGTKKKTTEIFKKQVFELVGKEYEVISEYVHDTKKVFLIHSLSDCGHKFEMTPSGFLQGNRCPECGIKIRANKRTLTHKQFIAKINSEWLNEYLLIDTYTGSKNKIRVKHINCNRLFDTIPSNIYKEHGCPHCAKENSGITLRKSHSKFEEEVQTIANGEYKVLSSYINTNTHIHMKHLVCGNEYIVLPSNFLRGNRCPICNESKGEREIREWLKHGEIKFESQVEFDGLIGMGGGLLSYDFYLPDKNILIEYQGEFHDGSGGEYTQVNLKKQQEHDKRKKEYAKKNGIELLEIWYWDYDKIASILADRLCTHTNNT